MRSFILSAFILTNAASSPPFLAKNEEIKVVEVGDLQKRNLNQHVFAVLLSPLVLALCSTAGLTVACPHISNVIADAIALPMHTVFIMVSKAILDEGLKTLLNDRTITQDIYNKAQYVRNSPDLVDQALEAALPMAKQAIQGDNLQTSESMSPDFQNGQNNMDYGGQQYPNEQMNQNGPMSLNPPMNQDPLVNQIVGGVGHLLSNFGRNFRR